jgi:hypothetical protein
MIIPYAVVADHDCTNALTTSHHCETLSFTMDQPPHVFEQLGSELMQRDPGRQTRTGDRRFRSTFGTTAVVCCRLWHLLQPVQTMQQGASPRHLLWALMLLKSIALSRCYLQWPRVLTRKPSGSGRGCLSTRYLI